MRVVRLTAIAAFFAAAAALAMEGPLVSAGDKNGKGAHRLVLGKVRVSEKTKDGKAWDVNDGKPDIVVRIKNMSDNSVKEFVSEERSDTFEGTYNVPTILASDGDKIRIEVVDKDLAIEDLIGRIEVTVGKEIPFGKAVDLKFDQVLSLTVEARKP